MIMINKIKNQKKNLKKMPALNQINKKNKKMIKSYKTQTKIWKLQISHRVMMTVIAKILENQKILKRNKMTKMINQI